MSLSKASNTTLQPATAETAQLNADMHRSLRNLIITSLGKKYVSKSSFMDYETGNRYQSVRLGSEVVDGYRSNRSDLFQTFDFSGRSVLDCGCNIGELSRLARLRGAKLVDGYEYDNYFVEIGRLINAYNGTTRVSFYNRDVTKPDSFDDYFDVTMAFSVYPYISQVLNEIARITGEALIVETHDIKPDLKKIYIDPLIKLFPYYTFLTTTDFGRGEEKRAIFVFAKQERSLYGAGALVKSTLDVKKSEFRFLDAVFSTLSGFEGIRDNVVDALTTTLSACQNVEDDSVKVTAGKSYWIAMMQGYVEYKKAGRITEDNTYLKAFKKTLETVPFDAALSEKLNTFDAISLRLLLRFKDVDAMVQGGSAAAAITPVRIMKFSHERGKYRLRHGEFDMDVYCDLLDGYHRIFWAKLLGLNKLNALFVLD